MIIEIIKGTPMWVFLLFALLIYRGILAANGKMMNLKKLFIMPIVFLFLMGQKMSANPAAFLGFLVVGCFIGWLIYKNIEIKADKEKKQIFIPGSYMPLILIIVAFSKGYFIGYTTAVHPELVKTFWFTFGVATVSGIFSGMFIGRTAIYLYKYNKAEHQELPVDSKK
jgi:hypothetical protein